MRLESEGGAPAEVQRARGRARATRLVFFINGFAASAWAPLVPFAKARLGLGDGTLGLVLLSLGLGSIVTMPLAGALASRFGCRRVIVASVVLLGLALPWLAAAPSVPVLAAALFVFGAGVGATDVTVNIQAIIVERAAGRPMMSGFHGLYSAGGIAGALGATAMMAAGASPIVATLAALAGIVGALALATRDLLPRSGESAGPMFALPHGVVWLIGAACFIMFLAEGAVLDWSAVFLNSDRGVARADAGLGYAAFAAAMTIGRLLGDRLVRRFGGGAIILAGGLTAAGGMALATLAPWPPLALAGFALVGAGCANIVPVLFTGVGQQKAMPQSVAVPAITTLGYAGVLVGPAAIGLVANATSLSAAFLILAALLAAVAASGRLLKS